MIASDTFADMPCVVSDWKVSAIAWFRMAFNNGRGLNVFSMDFQYSNCKAYTLLNDFTKSFISETYSRLSIIRFSLFLMLVRMLRFLTVTEILSPFVSSLLISFSTSLKSCDCKAGIDLSNPERLRFISRIILLKSGINLHYHPVVKYQRLMS